MLVWGGNIAYSPQNTGGRYNPATNAWVVATATSTAGAPAAPTARAKHTAVWTGTEMILHGGTNSSSADTEIIMPGQSYLYSKP
jgi:hypothetical protein